MNKIIAICACAAMFGAACSQDRPPDVAAPAEPASASATVAAAPVESATLTVRYMESPPDWVTTAVPSEQLACFLDVIKAPEQGQTPEEALSGQVQILGWSVDKTGVRGAAQKNAVIRISSKVDGKEYYFPAIRSPRPDVETAPEFSSFETTNSGIVSEFSLAGVDEGSYEVSFVVGDQAGASICSFREGRTLLVK